MGDCSKTSLSSEEHHGTYCSFCKILVTTSLLSHLGSSKSKQSPQFDPAKQAYAGKVRACHERRKRNVDDSVYLSGDLLGKAEDFFWICRMFPNSTWHWGAASSHEFLLCVVAHPIQEELSWGSSDSLVVSHLFIRCSHLRLHTARHNT